LAESVGNFFDRGFHRFDSCCALAVEMAEPQRDSVSESRDRAEAGYRQVTRLSLRNHYASLTALAVAAGYRTVSSELEEKRLYDFSAKYDKCDRFLSYDGFKAPFQSFPSFCVLKIV
jgi:hypothetical protein